MRQPSSKLLEYVRGWIADAKSGAAGTLNADGSGVMIYGDIGGSAYIRADGSIEIEVADEVPGNTWRTDPNIRTVALVCASKRGPIFAELLPERPTHAEDCGSCEGTGWMTVGALTAVCGMCLGLGWLSRPTKSLERTREG